LPEIAAIVRSALAERRATGAPGRTTPHTFAVGNEWSVADVVCTCGPGDRPFEEQHAEHAVALVVAGTFQHRTRAGSCSLTPGAFMFGNAGDAFECSHDHGHGDRCVSFWFDPGLLEEVAGDAGLSGPVRFPQPGLPPHRETADLAARISAAALAPGAVCWEELALVVAARSLASAHHTVNPFARVPSPADQARVLDAVHHIGDAPADRWPLVRLAREAGLSTFHFLRTFESVTGVTPHQYVRRTRLRRAATQLLLGQTRIIDVALDAGFDEASSFTRAFRLEFGCAPRTFTAAYRHQQ